MVEQCIDGIIVDDESYEVKAVRAHLSGTITVQDLQCSLELSRAQTYRLLKRYKEEGPLGLISRKAGVRNRAFPDVERQRKGGCYDLNAFTSKRKKEEARSGKRTPSGHSVSQL